MVKNRITQIIKPYFDWLDDLLGHLANEANQNNVSAGDIARDFLSIPRRCKIFNEEAMPALRDFVMDFWKINESIINTEIQSLPGLKARFGGDLGPQFKDHLFERIGLYFETVIVPDPLLRVFMMPNIADKNRDYYVLKYAISLLQFKDIYLADTFPPIAVLATDPELTKPNAIFENIGEVSKFDSVAVINKLYEEKLENYDEAMSFFQKFSNPENAVRNIVRPELFLLDETVSKDPISQFESYKEFSHENFSLEELEREWKGGQMLWFILASRIFQANDVLHQAVTQNAHPLIQAPVSFHWLKLKTETNQELISKELGTDINVELLKTNALLSKEFDWLSNVPLNTLIEFRQKGRLEEFRKLVSKDFNQLSDLSLQDVSRVTNQVDYNLSTAFEQHQEKMQELNTNLKQEMFISVPTLLLSITAALQPIFASTFPAWLVPVGGIVGAAKLKDVITAAAKYYRERKSLGKTPVGILWEAKKQTEDS
jgi:hypothetical protein